MLRILLGFCLLFLTLPSQASEENRSKRLRVRHILLAYQGAERAKKTLRRTRQDAEYKAISVKEMLDQGQDFAALARKFSDGPSGSRGGELGVFGQGSMHEAFEKTSFSLAVHEIGMAETSFGFHIIQRLTLVEVKLTHIVIQWRKGKRSKQKRSKKQALQRITEAHQQLRAGAIPQEIAQQYSDGPYGLRGGDVGWFQPGELNSVLDKAAFALQIGSVSEILETPVGYHILIRQK